MSNKNYGPATSGYLDPDLRNWENAVFEAGKPVLDKELNLSADIAGGFGLAALRRAMPSGWISDDFLATSAHASAIFVANPAADTLQIPQNLIAHVNGWLLTVANTSVSGSNQLALPAGPVGAGARRTDVVVLEVWRRLISASPSTTGKSASGRIWRSGNVKTSPADDLTLNLTDDILDANVGSESTKRVQIQFRLRVLEDVDVLSFPDGLDDPTIVANTVPASAGAPDGVATLFGYTNQASNGDPGLWRAGDGNPANTLGTVDGYMYAIPLMAVFRRNSTAFDKNTNQNGGVATPGPSDRPDGLFCDVIDARDVADLRSGVSPTGWNYAEVLEKNVNLLLDNTLKTEWVLTGNGGGSVGHTVLWADEIGVSAAHGGDNVITGDTPGAAFVGEFDAVRRRFSDRPTYEVMTVKVPAPLGGWPSATVNVDFTSLAVPPYAAFNWASYAPAQVVCQDVLRAQFIGVAAGKNTFDAMGNIVRVENLGAMPIAALDITFDTFGALATPMSDEDLYLDLLVCYPAGAGLTLTPTADYGSASIEINNPLALPGAAPTSYSTLANTSIDSAHREVTLQYQTVNVVAAFAADTVAASSTFVMPERVQSIVSVDRNGGPIVGGTSVSSDGRTVTLTNIADQTSPGDTLSVTYTALRPLPQSGVQLTVWYEARGPQTVRDALLTNSLSLEPKYLPSHLYVITVGSGSQDEAYPFPHAYVQTGGIYPTSGGSFTGEHELLARAAMSVSDFSASTGFLKLPTFVPMVPNSESLTFQRAPGDADFENRTYFKAVPAGYVPNTYAQDLSDPAKHKVVYPLLAELTSSTAWGKKGELVLVLVTRWASFDQTNGVFFDSNLAQNTTTASVFRLKSNLLNKRA